MKMEARRCRPLKDGRRVFTGDERKVPSEGRWI